MENACARFLFTSFKVAESERDSEANGWGFWQFEYCELRVSSYFHWLKFYFWKPCWSGSCVELTLYNSRTKGETSFVFYLLWIKAATKHFVFLLCFSFIITFRTSQVKYESSSSWQATSSLVLINTLRLSTPSLRSSFPFFLYFFLGCPVQCKWRS